jgi:hypothetical protein
MSTPMTTMAGIVGIPGRLRLECLAVFVGIRTQQRHPPRGAPMPLRSGDVVARRPLEIYAAVGQRLAGGAPT